MKTRMNPRKKYAIGTGQEGIDFSMQELPMQETPAQKAVREAKEARLAKRAELVAAQKAKNAVRLAPIEAAQQQRFQTWKNSSADNANKSYEDWQDVLVKAQNAPDVPIDGLMTNEAKKGYKTKGSCTTDTKIEKVKLTGGTGSMGILNPRRKYANGTKNIDPNNYIISPAETMNDYNIMLNAVEAKAASDPMIPIAAAIGGATQSFVGNAGMYTKKEGNFSVTGSAPDTTNPAFQSPIGDRYKTAANGNNDVQADVEVEGGEMYETPQGEVGEFEGPSHEQGGIPLEVVDTPVANPNNGDVQKETKVYSDQLIVAGQTLAERKEARERKTANLEKIASQPLVDQAVKNSTKRKMMAIEKEEMADLDFQEKVNNMQAMADTMVVAFGTGMAGLQDNPIGDSMRYGYGSGSKGVMKYDDGGIIDPPVKFPKPILAEADYDQNIIKNWHDVIGITSDTPDYGVAWGPKSKKAMGDYQTKMFKDNKINQTADYNTDLDYMLSGGFGPVNQKASGLTTEGYKYLGPEAPTPIDITNSPKVWDKSAFADGSVEPNPLLAITEAQPEETSNLDLSKVSTETPTAKKQSKAGKFFSSMSMPGVGDLTKMFGNYLGMTAGIKTAGEQRATDVTHTNVYKNAGQESQKLLDNAKQGIEASKAQAIVKATSTSRGGKRGGRNSARGVNQMRGVDWLYDTALQQQIADISAKSAEQISAIDIQKSGVAMNADQLKGQGEYQAAMANEAAKDAYYTALGLGRKDFATGMQQTGKDLNDMKTNKILEKLLSQDGEYAGLTASGEFFGKPSKRRTSTSSKTSDSIEIPDGKGGKMFISQAEYKKLIAGLT